MKRISRFILVPFLATAAACTPGLWANPPSGVDMPPLGKGLCKPGGYRKAAFCLLFVSNVATLLMLYLAPHITPRGEGRAFPAGG